MADAFDVRPGFAPMLARFGVPATVTRPAPHDTPIETRALWLGYQREEMPNGAEFTRQEPRRLLALPLAEVPTVPIGTRIEAPEALGLVTQTWQVDGIERREYDAVRVMVLPVGDAT